MSSRLEESFMILEESLSGRQPPQAGGWAPSATADRLDESFVVLPQSATRRPGGAPHGVHSITNSAQQQRFTLHDHMETLARVLEIASDEAAVDLPLCADCASEVLRELETEAEELQKELNAYEALEERLRKQAEEAEISRLDERSFQRELRRAQEEAQVEAARLKKAEAELEIALARKREADDAAARLYAIEISYWLAFNTVMLALHAAADHRDALQQRVDGTERSLASLRRTSVLSDLFRIWHDGPFGTISGLRLGSTPELPVEWWEINAAWGQAVMLLDALARALHFKFSKHRLEPRGSYARIHDNKGAAELFSPASKIVCFSFDRAQVAFLTCLKEFAEALAARGVTLEERVVPSTSLKKGGHGGTTGPRPFALIYPIDGDRVGGQSIRYALSRDKAWTKALKYSLVNLKYCLKGTLQLMDRRRVAAATVAALPREGPGPIP